MAHIRNVSPYTIHGIFVCLPALACALVLGIFSSFFLFPPSTDIYAFTVQDIEISRLELELEIGNEIGIIIDIRNR